jgi:perosamine synthetase
MRSSHIAGDRYHDDVKGPIRPYNSIGKAEIDAAVAAMEDGPLSGYLAGKERGGKHVCALEDAWCETFGVKHAIAVNSNTSGLMAAAFAVDFEFMDTFACPATTMSATAAAPLLLRGNRIAFQDIEDETFGLHANAAHMAAWGTDKTVAKATFVTNLFGHPARHLSRFRDLHDRFGGYLIEDNAQSPFAMEHGRYAGTIGHIGVWSLNVHKHFQCGEGGICTTDDDDLAAKMRAFINHGEHVSDRIGLNLRLNEVSAAIALAQLRRGKSLVQGRVEQAEAIIDAIGNIPGLRPPVVRDGCTHVYYTIPFLVEKNRAEFCAALREEGVPIEEGYVEPLYRMSAFKQFARPCPVAEDLQDRRLFYIENCAYDFTPEQVGQIGDSFKKAAEKWL